MKYIVLAHKGYFDKASEKKYRENSRELVKVSSRKKHISIIELDIRKSKDGGLYCYHGGLVYYLFLHRFRPTFAKMRQKYGVDTLADVLDVIPKNKTVFLDLKDTSITRSDLLKVLRGRKFKEMILGNKSVRFLRRFHDMPPYCVKIMNGNIFCKFYNLAKLKQENYRYIEPVFSFQVSKNYINHVRKTGLGFRLSGKGCFMNKKNYFAVIDKYCIKHISSDYV